MASGVNPYAPQGQGPVNPYAPAEPEPEQGPSYGRMAIDVAKQIPSGIVTGIESVATFPAQVAGMVAPLAERYAPSWLSDPEANKQQAEFRADIAKQRGRGIAEYLPDPETRAGRFTRAGLEFIPSVVLGSKLALPRAIGVGATTGVVSEAAGQAAEEVGAGEYAPYARVGGALVAGPIAARRAEGAATKAAAKSVRQDVKEESNVLYEQFRNSGFQLDPAAAQTLSRAMLPALERQGFTETTAGPVLKAIENWSTKPWKGPQDFQSAYQELGHLRNSSDTSVRYAAGIAQENLLTFLEKHAGKFVTGGPGGVAYAGPQGIVMSQSPEAAAALFEKANANWAAVKRAERLDQKITAGELRAGANYSGLNLENELRRRVGSLADPNVRGGFSKAEQEAFDKYAKGTFRSNAPRYVKGLLGGGGGIGATIVGGGGLGLGSYLGGGDPLMGAAYGVGAPLLGLSLARYGNARALNRARELELMLLSRAPSANIGTQSNISRMLDRARTRGALAAPTLAQLGED